MKYLCLAYGDEETWNALSRKEQDELLAQDEVLRKRGDLVAAVGEARTVKVVEGELSATREPFSHAKLPLAGFGIIEARDLDHLLELISDTPCVRANGAVEVWPVRDTSA